MKVDVEPQAFAKRSRVSTLAGCGTVADHPARAVLAGGSRDNRVASEARPSVEIGVDRGRVSASESDQIACRGLPEGGQQIKQQSRSKGTIADV